MESIPTIHFASKKWAKVAADFEIYFSDWEQSSWDGEPYTEESRKAFAFIPPDDAVMMNDQLISGRVKIVQIRRFNPDEEKPFFSQTMVIDTPESIKMNLNYRLPFYMEGDPLSLDPDFRVEDEEE